MSARHRQHKKRIAEAERDLDENDKDQAATRRVMDWLLEHGHDKLSAAVHTLEHVLVQLEADCAALHEVMKVLAPDGPRPRALGRWRAL